MKTKKEIEDRINKLIDIVIAWEERNHGISEKAQIKALRWVLKEKEASEE